MFRCANDNLITRLKAWTRIALSNHVDRFRCAAGPDDGFVIRRINQACDFFPRGFIACGQALGFSKLAAMDVSGAQAIKLVGSLNHRLWLQRRSSAVEIDASIVECGKLCAKLRGVKSVHGIPQFSKPIVAQKGH
ncbi:Uncharacterised protein [Citrobacter freundii]|nr:Uncharacterised protein [Citrobacter freundii]